MKDVKQRLDEEFEQLYTLHGNSLIQRIILSVDQTIAKFEQEIRQEALQEQEEEGHATESESSDDDLSAFDI